MDLHLPPSRARFLTSVWAALLAISGLYVASYAFGRGGWTYFSPYTLDSQSQSELLIPLTRIPIYRSLRHTYRHKLVQFLIDEKYWLPTTSTVPPIVTQHWNSQWRDGHGDFLRQFAWRAEGWIQWTRSHREIADELWPEVLRLLRSSSENAMNEVSRLMMCATVSESLTEFQSRVRMTADWGAM